MKEEEILLQIEGRRILRQLNNVLTLHSALVIGELLEEQPSEAAFGTAFAAFLKAALRDLEKRRNHAGGLERAQTWEIAITVMSEHAVLRKALWDGRKEFALRDPQIAFRMLAKRALSKMRSPLLAKSQSEDSNWRNLDRISRALVVARGEALKANFSRCSKEHYRELRQYIREQHPKDHKLPRDLETIEDYFELFCPDCANRPFDETEGGGISAGDILLLPGHEIRLDFLEDCLELLEGIYQDVMNVTLLRPDAGGVNFPTAHMYCKARNVSRRRFFESKNVAMQRLLQCIGRKEENVI